MSAINWQSIKAWAHALKRDAIAVYFAARDARTPWYTRLLALAIAAYAISPIDLIPDFIPVLGYLDEVILLPAALWLVIRMVPAAVMEAARQQANLALEKPVSWIAAVLIGLVWIFTAALLAIYFYKWCVG